MNKNIWLQKEAVTKIQAIIIAVIIIVAFIAGVYSHPLIFPSEVEVEDPIWARVKESGKIRIGSSPDWPPFEFYKDGEWAGFEVELMEMVAERLDLTVEWKEMSFKLIIPEIKDKALDLGISGFSVYPKRLEVVQFTMPHSITEGQIVMLKSRRDALGITDIDSLEELVELGLTVGTQEGTTQHDELAEKAEAALAVFDDFVLALYSLKDGIIDGVYSETPITSWWMLEAEEAGEEPLVVIYRRPYWPVAWVANKDADTLVMKINGALAEIITDGKLDELKAKWKC